MATQTATLELEKRLQANPDSLAFSRLADQYRKAGDISRAIDLCVRGLEKHPGYVTGRIILGRCYLEQENLDMAVEAFTDVCKLDRRNIVALKMIADIFMRKGSAGNAGDLYALLASMDPWNDTLAKIAARNHGSGRRDLYEILGLTAELPPTVIEEARPAPFPAPVPDTQIVAPQEFGIAPAPEPSMVDVTAGTEVATAVNVEEVLAEAAAVTGNDVSDRMTEMFEALEDDRKNPQPETPIAAPEPVFEARPAEKPEEEITETIEVHPITDVPDGSAISSRIDDLFGKETAQIPAIRELKKPEEPATDGEQTIVEELLPSSSGPASELEETMVFGEEQTKRLRTLGALSESIPAPAPEQSPLVIDQNKPAEPAPAEEQEEAVDRSTRPPAVEELVIDAQESVDELVRDAADEDAADNGLFEPFVGATRPEKQEAETPGGIPAEAEHEETISGDDVAAQIDGIFREEKTETEELLPEVQPAAAVSPAASQEETRTDIPLPDETITGDDVVERLEGIFKRMKGPASVAGLEKEHEKEETKTGMPKQASAGAHKPAPAGVDGDLADSVIETQDVVSGSDIEERLTEIFPEQTESAGIQETGDAAIVRTETGGIEKFEETMILESVPDLGRTPAIRLGNAQQPDVEETVEAHPLDEETISASAVAPESGGAEEQDEQEGTAVFEEFSPGMMTQQDDRDIDKEEKPYDIPDHVLTPTLADLYFQQGQARLALSIYRRILQRSGGGPEMLRKIAEIERAIAQGVAAVPPQPARPVEKTAPASQADPVRKPPKRGRIRPKPEEDTRPLAGVRIKRRPEKLNWRKRSEK